jgi:hypothetical protein
VVDGGEKHEGRNGDVSGDEGEGFCCCGRHRCFVGACLIQRMLSELVKKSMRDLGRAGAVNSKTES